MALTTARVDVLRSAPMGLLGGINGRMSLHWSSLRSVGYLVLDAFIVPPLAGHLMWA
jgi:hypothetical protein